MDNTLRTCGNCGANEMVARKMVALADAHTTCLCETCIDEIHAFAHEKLPTKFQLPADQRTPRDIVAFLDNYIVGQDEAKKTLAIAVSNHYKRLGAAQAQDVEIDKSNVLLLGPTGTGKTLLAATIARLLNVPFTVADATSLTQAGYVGDDAETILQRLIEAADGDIEKAEHGIVFIDEFDKLAKAGAGTSITRDVSGEGVQQALLKIIEGARVSVPVSGNRKNPGGQVNYINTKNILFICAGAFVQLLENLRKPKDVKSIGFILAVASEAEKATEVTPEMLFKFGMIPEVVGRLPVIAVLDALDVDALAKILTEPKNSIVRQMQAMFALDSAELTFEAGAIRALAEQAYKLKTGARGARSILEKLLKQAQYEVPGTTGAVVTVKSDLTVAIEHQPLKLAA